MTDATAYSESRQATLALVLSILGFLCCGATAPFAWALEGGQPGSLSAGGLILGIYGALYRLSDGWRFSPQWQ